MPLRFVLLIAAFTFSTIAVGQNISGTWVGNYSRTLFIKSIQKLVVEIDIEHDSIVTGASHLYYEHNQYEHYTIKGKYHKKDSTITFLEDSIIAIKLGFSGKTCLGIYKMKLHITDSSMKFKGRWTDKSHALFHCLPSGVWFEKKLPKKHTSTTTEKHDPVQPKEDKKLTRTTDIQSLIEVTDREKDSIKVDIYDNGQIDNDSVSVYYNDVIVIHKKMISLTPLTFYISLNKQNPLSKIKLIAESVGSLPPCTALMIVTTKKKRYEVNLSSNFSKNAAIELFLKE